MKFADLEISMRTDLSKVIGEINAANKKLDEVSENTKRAADAADKSAGFIERSAGRMVSAFKVVAVAAVATGTVIAAKFAFRELDAAAEKVDNLGKVSKQLQIPIRDLSILRFAAGESGVEFETLATMSAKASKNIAEFAAGGKHAMRIGDITVELRNARGFLRNITDLLPDIARGIESADSAGEKISLATKIFGKEGGAQFVKFLADGGTFAKNLADQAERAGKLGVIFNDDQVSKLTAYRDAVGRIEEAYLGVKVAVMTEVAPVLTTFSNHLALQLGSLPNVVRAAGRAMSSMLSDDPVERLFAKLDFAELTGGFGDVLLNVFKQGARIVGSGIVEGANVAVTVIGPPLADMLRDHVGPILNEIPGINIEKSIHGKIAAYKGDIGDIAEEAGRIAKIQMEIAENGSSPLLNFQLKLREEHLSIMAEKFKAKFGDLQAMKAEAQALDESREAATREAIKSGLAKTKAVYEDASKEMTSSIEKFNETKERIFKKYLPPEPEAANTSGVGFAFGDWLVSLGDKLEVGTIRLEAVQPRLAAIMDKLQAKSREILEFGKSLNVRSMKASGDGEGAERLQLLNSFDREIAELSSRLGTSLIPQLQAVQAAELAAFDAKKVNDMNESTRKWIESLKKTHDPMGVLKAELQRLKEALGKGLIDPETYEKLAEGITKQMEKLKESGKDVWQSLAEGVEGFSDNAARTFADFVVDGKASFTDLLKSFERMLVETAMKKLVFDQLFGALGGVFGSFSKTGQARGGVWEAGAQVTRYALGTVVSQRSQFAMANGGVGEMAEEGPEAIMPLQRIGGYLGVRSTGGGGTVVNFIDQRSGGERETTESTGSDGKKMITTIIRDTVKGEFASGGMDSVMRSTFGLRRQGAPR